MARRKYPFYRPVSHRVTDKYRGAFAGFFYDTFNSLIGLGILWMIAFFFARWMSLQDATADPITFAQWSDWTFNGIVFPILGFVRDLAVSVVSGAF